MANGNVTNISMSCAANQFAYVVNNSGVTIRADGSLLWNQESLNAEALEQKLAATAQEITQPVIRLYGDTAVLYGKVMCVLAQTKRAGVTQIWFVTEPATQ